MSTSKAVTVKVSVNVDVILSLKSGAARKTHLLSKVLQNSLHCHEPVRGP